MTTEWLKKIARLYLPVYHYETETMKIIYAGYSSIKMNYYIRMLLNGNNHHTFLGRRWYWKIQDLIKTYNPDIVVAEISQIALKHYRKYNGYLIPEWAAMRIFIDRPMIEICKRQVSDFSNVARLIRKYDLTYEILTDDESFKYFYERMYLPFIRKRHKNEAWIINLNSLWRSTPSPVIIAIKEGGVIVGASIIRKSGDSLSLIYLGLLDGNEDYLRHGVIGAIYYFGILEGKKMDCQYLDVGGSRPFLTDRLTEFKLGLGAKFVSEPTHGRDFLWLGINDGSSAAQKFIRSNPFIYLTENNKLDISGK